MYTRKIYTLVHVIFNPGSALVVVVWAAPEQPGPDYNKLA